MTSITEDLKCVEMTSITEDLKYELDESKDSCSSEGMSNMSSDLGNSTLNDPKTLIITNEMEEEEKQFAAKAAEEEERVRKEYEQRLQKEEEENKQKRLYHLLSRSQFYTNFLVKKIDSTLQEEKRKSELKKKQEERRAAAAESRHLKEIKNGTALSPTNPKPSKRKREEKSKITDYINKEAIKNVQVEEEDADGIFKSTAEMDMGTRVTSMGFEVSNAQPLLFEGGVLRLYQLQGLEWMKVLYENGVNGILADEMGLGKTIQVIALICHMIEKNVLGPFLIIAPLSTLPNWVMEFEKMAPQVPVVLFHGSKYERPKLYHKLTKRVEVMGKQCAPVIITSYQVPQMEFAVMSRMKWRYIIVDEGHVLKNMNCQLGRCLRSMKSINRLLLTGTPLQNNLTELWALLNFLLPDVFDDLNVFGALFHLEDIESSSSNILMQEEKHNVLSTLHQILKPFLLRRLKVDVEINIPPKKELLVYCPMTTIQLDMYRTTVDRTIVQVLRPKLYSGAIEPNPDGTMPKRKCAAKRKNYNLFYGSDEDSDSFETMREQMEREEKEAEIVADKNDSSYKVKLTMVNPAMQLRKIVNHPYLIHTPINPDRTLRVDEELVNKSGKMLVVDALLTRLKQRGHKVLFFTFFKIVLDLMEEFLLMRGMKYVRLDGNYNFEERRESIRQFNTNPDIFVFLITTRAGGLGLNLTAADTVIIFDSDWNPQADLQAMDRCHRIGQTKPTVVYRLVTKGTVDERIISVAARKRKLEKIVIKKGQFKLNLENKQDSMKDLEELRELLDSTDHEKVMHSNGFVFSDQELEELLDRSDMMSDQTNNSEKPNVKTENKVFKVIKTTTESPEKNNEETQDMY